MKAYTCVHANPGSPPRAWGKLRDSFLIFVSVGLTPTCVGKTHLANIEDLLRTAHPHVRGENKMYRRASILRIGSPPRAWGKPI